LACAAKAIHAQSVTSISGVALAIRDLDQPLAIAITGTDCESAML
jgi:hypothetical protein